jgi:hypothetical protein
VEVADSTGVVLYARGVDYELEPTPGGLFLRRLPTGAIPPGALVRVSYEYVEEGEGNRREELESVGTEVGFRAHGGLYVRVAHVRSDPRGEAEGASPGFQPSRRRTLEAGWIHEPLRLSWERVRRREAVLPFDRERVGLRAATPIGSRWRASAEASRGWTDFLDGGPRFTFRDARLELGFAFRRGGGWTLEAGGREDVNESGRVTSWFAATRCVLRRAFGEITFEWREDAVHSPSTGGHRTRRLFVGLERRLR